MSSNNHREVAKLDRVPLPVEAARFGVTGWQLTRTAARVLTKLPTKGPMQQKVIKQIPQTFSDLGPTYVKFGQIIPSSPGAFGEQLSREFRGLLDRVPPADKDQVHKLLAEDLGGDPAELFATFEEEPFASASIAQVHYATLHSGEEVVVKIQRPGIRRRVAADLQILRRFAQAVELAKLGRRLSAQDVVADFSDNLAEELDFRLEAQSMDAWVSHLHASPLGKNIRVPQVHWTFTTERVLTMERIQGIRIDDAAAIRKAGFDGTELVKALLFSVFEGGLRHGLFHGDLHAGNLYVDDQGRIVFFDFGIMGRIDPRTRWLRRVHHFAPQPAGARGDAAHDTEGEEHDAALVVDVQVAGVQVAVEQAVPQPALEQAEQQRLDQLGAVEPGLADRGDVIDADALHPLHRQHPLGGVVPVHLWHPDVFAQWRPVHVRDPGVHRLCLEAEVQLLGQVVAEVGDHVLGGQPAAQLGQLHGLGEALEDLQIGGHPAADARPLDLHDDLFAAVQGGVVHLGDRRRRERLFLEGGEQLRRVAAEVLGE